MQIHVFRQGNVKARSMRQHFLDRNLVFAVLTKGRPMLSDWIGVVGFSFAYQHVDGGGDDSFGATEGIKQRIRPYHRVGGAAAAAVVVVVVSVAVLLV